MCDETLRGIYTLRRVQGNTETEYRYYVDVKGTVRMSNNTGRIIGYNAALVEMSDGPMFVYEVRERQLLNPLV